MKKMVLGDREWERLGRAWQASRVGSPGRLRERERERLDWSLDRSCQASCHPAVLSSPEKSLVQTTTPAEGGAQNPWRNPGDHHAETKKPFEEHTISSAQHAAASLARHPHSPARSRPLSASLERRAGTSGSPSSRKKGIAGRRTGGGQDIRAGEDSIRNLERFTTDEVISWLDRMFEHDDEERRNLRHAAIRQASQSPCPVCIHTPLLDYRIFVAWQPLRPRLTLLS